MTDIIVVWAQRALDYFWSYGGTQEEKKFQDNLVKDYAAAVDGAISAEIM